MAPARPFTDDDLAKLTDRAQSLSGTLIALRRRLPDSRVPAEELERLEAAVRQINGLVVSAALFNAEAMAVIAIAADARRLRAELLAEAKR